MYKRFCFFIFLHLFLNTCGSKCIAKICANIIATVAHVAAQRLGIEEVLVSVTNQKVLHFSKIRQGTEIQGPVSIKQADRSGVHLGAAFIILASP